MPLMQMQTKKQCSGSGQQAAPPPLLIFISFYFHLVVTLPLLNSCFIFVQFLFSFVEPYPLNILFSLQFLCLGPWIPLFCCCLVYR